MQFLPIATLSCVHTPIARPLPCWSGVKTHRKAHLFAPKNDFKRRGVQGYFFQQIFNFLCAIFFFKPKRGVRLMCGCVWMQYGTPFQHIAELQFVSRQTPCFKKAAVHTCKNVRRKKSIKSSDCFVFVNFAIQAGPGESKPSKNIRFRRIPN